jgi:hypothetical protein
MTDKEYTGRKMFYRPKEAAKLLGFGLVKIYDLIHRGELEAFKPKPSETTRHNFTLITRASIVAFLGRLTKYDGTTRTTLELQTCPFCGGKIETFQEPQSTGDGMLKEDI